ncbi:MAG: cob(I)yrinic acid a,c-diamide adenosyltransferase [Bacteroidales bacterium]|nr:cob(I)yrinic acid a,c-diamide adenosyltransferase [Bacteroidales bacterium]
MKKSNIYTGKGDKGQTSLVGGVRVKKTDLRLEAYGTVDELNSFLGLLIAEVVPPKDSDLLTYVQNKLFCIGSYLATDPTNTEYRAHSSLNDESIKKLEKRIDEIDDELPTLNNFVLPGGAVSASFCHVCRTVCRRAERAVLRVSETDPVDEKILRFMNRLSDYLFILSRYCNLTQGTEEVLWDKSCD